ncbi:uncharacterized protein B0H64DRAFT_8648 [Chaetomium fimeti]|uniref:Uncharacterized protein n=1 Tax=Chaetomium fimeti TaxID=1854472 RepID=A0AAE0HP91_9PEZI|nr:hypothetical protein B0H64DRAFT_8648 [Chaetomium fimeti]
MDPPFSGIVSVCTVTFNRANRTLHGGRGSSGSRHHAGGPYCEIAAVTSSSLAGTKPVGSTRRADRRLQGHPAPAYLDRALLLLAICRRGSRWHVCRSPVSTLGSWNMSRVRARVALRYPGVLELLMHHRFTCHPFGERAGGEAANCRGWHRPAKFEQSWAAEIWGMGGRRHGVRWGMRTGTAIPVGLFCCVYGPRFERWCSGPKNRPGGMGGLRKSVESNRDFLRDLG